MPQKNFRISRLTSKMISLLPLLMPFLTFSQSSYKCYEAIDEMETTYGYQLHANEASFIGDYDLALEYYNKNFSSSYQLSEEEIAAFKAYQPVEARDYIISIGKDQQLIMLNEAHHNYQHRDFTRSILSDLYEQGFKYLGLEALFEDEKKLSQRGYPVIKSGYYTKEHHLANLIREALDLGYTVFPYDTKGGQGPQREINQAEAISEVLKENPDAKMIIHAGYDHIREDGKVRNWGKAMASRVKDMTGIDPYTIDMVQMTNQSTPDRNNPYFNLAEVSAPSLFMKENEIFIEPRRTTYFDAQVFIPSDYSYQLKTFDSEVKTDPTKTLFVFDADELKKSKVENLIPVNIFPPNTFEGKVNTSSPVFYELTCEGLERVNQ